MGYIKLNQIGEKACTGIRFTWSEVSSAESGNYNFSTVYGEKIPAWGLWGSPFRFDITAENVCDANVNGGADTYYIPHTNGTYGQVTVQDEVVSWSWSEPVYFYGKGSTFGDYGDVSDYIYVQVEGEGDDGGGSTDVETVEENLTRIRNAKAAIKTAIENKGVTVGDVRIDEYAALIGMIEGGSAGGGETVDFSLLGYNSTNSSTYTDRYLQQYNYSLGEYNNWIPQDNMERKYSGNWDMLYVPNFNFTGVRFANFFFSESGVKYIPQLTIPESTQLMGFFENCSNIDEIDTTDWICNSITLTRMFSGCSTMWGAKCGNLITEGADCTGMFINCSNLNMLDLSGADFTNTTCISMFGGCTNLNHLTFGTNYDYQYLNLADCPLTVESLLSVFNGLATRSGGTVYLGQDNYDQLTAEQIQIATAKGWTVSPATGNDE